MKLNLTGLTHDSFLRCLEILGRVRRLRALSERQHRDRLRPSLSLEDLADECYLAVRNRDNGLRASQAIRLAARILEDARNPPVPPAPPKREEDSRSGHYYVSVIRDGNAKDYRLLRGPFLAHAEALDRVDETRQMAEKLDPKATWYGYGTCRIAPEETDPPQGMLNDRF